MKHGVFGPTQDGKAGEIYSNLAHVSLCLSSVAGLSTIIVGGGKGVEALAEQYAAAQNIIVERVPPNFHGLFGSKIKNPTIRIETLPIALRQTVFAARNDEIIMRSDKVVFFWDGEFFEIGQLIRRALLLRKPILLFPS